MRPMKPAGLATCVVVLLAPLAARCKPPTAPLPTHLGVYRWGAPKGPAQVDSFAKWIGRRDVWAEDFEPSDQWGNVTSPTSWFFAPWQKWLGENSGRRLILTVPMLVGPWNLSGPTTGPEAGKAVSLKLGAQGVYNHYYLLLAQNLVAYGLSSSYIRLGHEMNGGWYTWRASADAHDWPIYWRQIVSTMRSVRGAHFQFVWNPASGYLQLPAEQVYPGDKYVDVIGLDLYDQCWAQDTYPIPPRDPAADVDRRRELAWNTVLLNGDHGLAFWYHFANVHHKPFAIPEWGVCNRTDGHGGGDDALFVRNMHTFMTTHNVLFDVYFDVDAGDGDHQLSPDSNGKPTAAFPRASATFRRLFGGKP